MRRFFTERIRPDGDRVCLGPPESGHISRVLRMGPGDRLVLMDGTGARYEAVISSARPDRVELRIEKALPPPPAPPIEITLGVSLLKSGPMDFLVQKASELGVRRIRPFVARRTVVRPPGPRVENRLRHWREVSRNAAEQSDRSLPAEVSAPVPLEDLLEEFGGGGYLKLLLWEGERTADLKGVLGSREPSGTVVALVGPEGGFTDEEVHASRESGFIPVSLGRRILRAETAGIAVTALLQYEWGDLHR